MKVLFINTVYGKGSTGRIIQDLGTAVEENGGEYRVAFGRGNSEDIHTYKIGNDMDTYIHASLSRITDRSGFYSTHATKRLIEFIKKYNPDIIHLHNLHGYYINIRLLFTYLSSEFEGKIVWTLHDCWAYTGHCTYYTWTQCYRWKNKCFQCPQKNAYPKSIFMDSSKRNYEEKKSLLSNLPQLQIVTVSDWLKSEVEQSFLSKYPIQRIYNGIDLNVFHYTPTEKRLSADKKVILSVSDGWSKRKGLPKILDVAQAAPADWIFVVVGLNKDQISSLPNNVYGIERTWNQQELAELYSLAHVFFNPSVEETFGLVTAEAISCGTPAVVMNSTASPELVKHTNYGKILNIESTTAEIIDALKITMATKKREYSNDYFSKEKFVTNYLALYSKLYDEV